MLGGMRKVLDKHQKPMLVVLAVLLITGWAVLSGGRRGPRTSEPVLGNFHGRPVTETAVQGFAERWSRLGLAVRLGDGYRQPLYTHLLLLAARDHGVRVSPEVIRKRLRRYPPHWERIEYVLADPGSLADPVEPSEQELREHYTDHWEDKEQPFEAIRDSVASELRRVRARRVAEEKIREARSRVEAAPREGHAWKGALREAAAATGLEYDRTRPFTEDSAGAALRSQAGLVLTEDLTRRLFDIAVGQPSEVLTSQGRLFFFRVVETSAGLNANGVMIRHDEGWRNGRFVILETYDSYPDLLRAKSALAPEQMARALEEFLTVQKFISLVCGDAASGVHFAGAARDELLALQAEQVRGLTAAIPARPLVALQQPDEEAVLAFYNEHKNAPPQQRFFGYKQPMKARIEYLVAPLADFEELVRVTDADVRTAYEHRKHEDFLDDEGKPLPLEQVGAGLRRELLEAKARRAARNKLRGATKRSEAQTGDALPNLPEIAGEEGLSYATSSLITPGRLYEALGDLADAPKLEELIFQSGLQPKRVRTREGRFIHLRPFSPVLFSRGHAFMFRILEARPAGAVEFSALSQEQQLQVRRDCAHRLAVQEAERRARAMKTEIARELLRLIVADNGLAVETAVVPYAPDEALSSVPPQLAAHLRAAQRPIWSPERLRLADAPQFLVPGEIARLVGAGEQHFTAVTTAVDAESNIHVEFVRFSPEQFTAAIRPREDAVQERARDLRDAALAEAEGDEPAREPTEAEIEKATALLLEEWRGRDFEARYAEYLAQRLGDAFRSYAEAHPLRVESERTLRQSTTPGFFHPEDRHVLGRDAALLEAAFELEPGKLSGPIVGDASAAVMLLEAEEARDEVKIEFVSVAPAHYDPLDEPVSDEEAAAYYEAHPDEFRPEAGGEPPPLEAALPLSRARARDERLLARAREALEAVREAVRDGEHASLEGALKDAALAAPLPFGVRAATTGYFDAEHPPARPDVTDAFVRAVVEREKGDLTEVVVADGVARLARVVDRADNRLVQVHYVRVPAGVLVAPVDVTADEARAHYETHAGPGDDNPYARPARIELEYLLADVADIRTSIEPDDDAVRNAYEQLKHRFPADPGAAGAAAGFRPLSQVRPYVAFALGTHLARERAAELADRAAERLREDPTRSFDDMAAELEGVNHTTSAAYVDGEPSPGALRSARGLESFLGGAEPGDVSPALRSPAGPVIVRVLERIPAQETPPFEEVKEDARANVARERGLERAREALEQVIERAKEPTAAALREAAEQVAVRTIAVYPVAVEETPFASRAMLARQLPRAGARGAQEGLGARRVLFTLRAGELSEPPVVMGERADTCFLAMLVARRELAPLSPDLQVWSEGQQVREARLRSLLRRVLAEFEGPGGAP